MFAQNHFQSLSEKVMMVGVTRLLEAGAELKEIATHMGWSIKHVTEVIKRHVALLPSMTDGWLRSCSEPNPEQNCKSQCKPAMVKYS